MNKFVIFAFAMTTISVAAAVPPDSCTPRDAKPEFNGQPNDKANLNSNHWKMFQGYIQEDQDGESLFVPFRLLTTHNYTMISDNKIGPHTWKMTLKADCADVDINITRASKDEMIYKFDGQQATYHFGGSTKTCELTLLPSEDGHPTYGCGDAKLVVQTMDMSMFMKVNDDHTVRIN